jgi:hypothetical protein
MQSQLARTQDAAQKASGVLLFNEVLHAVISSSASGAVVQNTLVSLTLEDQGAWLLAHSTSGVQLAEDRRGATVLYLLT